MNPSADIVRKSNPDLLPETNTLNLSALEAARVQSLYEAFLKEQNFLAALAAGLIAALLGAVAWGVVTVVTQFQIGFMALGVGYLVGFAVRRFGRGIVTAYGLLGATLALVGCILGNLISASVFLADYLSIPFMDVLSAAVRQPELALELLTDTFHPLDLLFYAIAIRQAYKSSFRKVTELELSSVS